MEWFDMAALLKVLFNSSRCEVDKSPRTGYKEFD